MASSFAMSETYGTSGAPTTTDTTYVNCLSTNTASGNDTTTNPNAAPITVPVSGNQASYERYIRGHWTGTFNSISSVLMWIQSWTPNTGCTLYGKDVGSQTYTTPTVPTVTTGFTVNTGWDTEGEALSLSYLTNYSDYVSMFLWVADTADAGTVNTWTLRTKWTET